MLDGLINSSYWVNTKSGNLEKLEEKVLLINFIRLGNLASINNLSFYKFINKITKNNSNFRMVSVHAPVLEVERNYQNVKKFIEESNIDWPVVLDNDNEIGKKMKNQYIPATYIFDKNWELKYEHFGEGQYQEIAEYLERLLNLDYNATAFHKHTPDCVSGSSDIFLGLAKSQAQFAGDITPGKIVNFVKNIKTNENSISFSGDFMLENEYIQAEGDLSEIYFEFTGLRSFLFAQASHPVPLQVFLYDESKGYYMSHSTDISTPKLYKLSDSNEIEPVKVLLKTKKGTKLFSISHSPCQKAVLDKS